MVNNTADNIPLFYIIILILLLKWYWMIRTFYKYCLYYSNIIKLKSIKLEMKKQYSSFSWRWRHRDWLFSVYSPLPKAPVLDQRWNLHTQNHNNAMQCYIRTYDNHVGLLFLRRFEQDVFGTQHRGTLGKAGNLIIEMWLL